MEAKQKTDNHRERSEPETLPVNFAAIPTLLQAAPQWVMWRWEADAQGNWKKPPFNAGTGSRASHSDSTSWSSFDAAKAAYESGRYAGIGFVLTSGIVVMDIDHCIDADGKMDPKAQAVLDFLGTYAEVSPSGTGIHCIASGSLPGPGRKRGRYEMYDTKRYITVTGAHMEASSREVAEAQPVLKRVYQRIFVPRLPQHPPSPVSARREGNFTDRTLHEQAESIIAYGMQTNAKFRAYFQGNATLWGNGGMHPSKSEADWHFCLILAYRTYGNAALMDCIFRRSGLFDAKWDRPTEGAKTYGEITIEKAIRSERHI
jgi:putative DNA primase/helicase